MSMIGGLPPPRPDQQYNPPGPPGPVGSFNGVLAKLRVANSIINPNGMFFYSGRPAAGNLIESLGVATGGTDQFGNVYLNGDTQYAPSIALATSLTGGALSVYGGPVGGGGPWTQIFSMATIGGTTNLERLDAGGTVALSPGTGGQSRLSGAVTIGQGAAVQTLVNGSTINTAGITLQPVTAAAAVTGIILQPGTFDGQVIVLPSDATAPNTITFAAAATSNVRSGTGAIIQPGQCMTLVWVASRSLWWQVQ